MKLSLKAPAQSVLALSIFISTANIAEARNTKTEVPVKEALQYGKKLGKIKAPKKFFFGKQKHPEVKTKIETVTSNLKTNAFGKSDEEACRWVFLSTMINFQKKIAEKEADAVVNIRSLHEGESYSNSKVVYCGAGAIMAGVKVTGDLVKFK